ncbi:CHAT domain-containing protein, partial [Collybia nuda]
LGIVYGDLYRRVNDLDNLEASIKYKTLAVNATPERHPEIAMRLQSLAVSYMDKYKRSMDIKDLEIHLESANQLYKSAIQSPTASPQDVWSASIAFTNQEHIFPPQDILEAYTAAFNILPSLIWLGSSLGNRHNMLIRSNVSTFVSKAVKFSLHELNLSLAVKFLEQGLSTTHKQNLQLKDDHAMLQAHLPILSQKLHNISAQLQGSSHLSNSSVSYHALANERQQLIIDIRKNPKFEDFLLPPEYAKLSLAAKNGPVILLNYNPEQTDIILIIKPKFPPSHLSLLHVKSSNIQENQQILKSALAMLKIHARNKEDRKNSKIDTDPKVAWNLLKTVTDWLWACIVKPIFDVLAEHEVCGGRLWWCPSGPFTYLPLHAAAPTKSRFIQSYIPTLDTLIQAYSEKTPDVGNSILTAIGVSKTLYMPPDGIWADIPSVEEELGKVTGLFGGKSYKLQGPEVSANRVVEAIQSSSWLHLACHGEQDPVDPLQSGLILYEEKLNLGQILDINLPKAKFVYLSACETAMGDGQLANEAMHLAGGFLSAGFLGAIGTLWSMGDSDGPEVAEIVYKTILGESNTPDVNMAAEGLHVAVQKLRKAGVPRYRWMPFVHFGV